MDELRRMFDRQSTRRQEPKIIVYNDIIEKNGKTVYENNMAIPHHIPIGTLVEVKYDRWHGGGACEKVHARLFVKTHARDCDGEPLYTLSKYPREFAEIPTLEHRGFFTEKELTIVPITREINGGIGALEWENKP